MVDILTGTAFDAPKRMNHREDEVALEFPSSVSSRARNLLALKCQNWRAANGGKSVTFVDGEYYNTRGNVLQNPSYSRIDTYIPVTGGHTVRWTWGTGASAYSPLIEYDDGTMVDYWSSTGSSGYRQVTLDAWCTRVRFAVPIDSKSIASLYDVTDGRYIFADGNLH